VIDGMTDRPTKISFDEMRESCVRGVLMYCAEIVRSLRVRMESERG
jgi:hypothetical protein